MAGPLGSGRTETARLVFGLDRSDSGSSPLGVLAPGAISSIIRLSGTVNSGWMRIATSLLVLGFIVIQRAITLRRDCRG